MTLIERYTGSIDRKHIVKNKPLLGDMSQYTFGSGETNFSYNNSTSLPENKDRFQNKDLNITAVGDKVNEAILERNLKEESNGFIRIDKCFVEFVGTPTPLKDVSISMYMWSKRYGEFWNEAAGLDNSFLINHAGIQEVLTFGDVEDRVFTTELGDLALGENIGNLSLLEGVNIVSNIIDNPSDNVNVPPLEIGSFSGLNPDFQIQYWTPDDAADAPLSKYNRTAETDARIFDKEEFNPIYLIFELKAHAPGNERDSRWQIFQINNLDLFPDRTNNLPGRKIVLSFDEMFAEEMFDGDGDDVSPEDPALKITDLQITVDASPTRPNAGFDDRNSYLPYFSLVKASPPFLTADDLEGLSEDATSEILFDTLQNDKTFFLNLSPKQELVNNGTAGINYSSVNGNSPVFSDYFPKQHIGVFNTNTNELESDVYLDEYRDNQSERIQSIGSSPALVSFEFEMMDSGSLDLQTFYPNAGGNSYLAGKYFYYFVINWDDKDNEIKSLDDWLDTKPTTIEELVELQQDNLYLPFRHYQAKLNAGMSGEYMNIDRYEQNGRPINLYTTPGLKTIKTIMFSSNREGSGGIIGRWKLITSRFFIGVSKSESPDFGDIGGNDYTTLPWPFTSPIIGGVDDESKYKKSIRESISCAKLSTTDIIDEELLSDDLQNDEMGKSINQMDLEQVRYFNKSYDINSLLNISSIPFYDDFDFWDGGSISSSFSEESLVGQIFINDNLDLDLKQSCQVELNTGNLTDISIYDSSGNSNKGLLIGDYKIKKPNKGEPMRRDSFIKVPKKTDNTNGAL